MSECWAYPEDNRLCGKHNRLLTECNGLTKGSETEDYLAAVREERRHMCSSCLAWAELRDKRKGRPS